MIRGLSQGSVLGRIPWNLGYNQILEAIPVRVQVICYTDNDTFIIAGDMEWTWTLQLTETAVAAITAKIQDLELMIAAQKIEALWIPARDTNTPHGSFYKKKESGLKTN